VGLALYAYAGYRPDSVLDDVFPAVAVLGFGGWLIRRARR